MVIVAGTIELDPNQREAFLAGRIDGMRTSRTELVAWNTLSVQTQPILAV